MQTVWSGSKRDLLKLWVVQYLRRPDDNRAHPTEALESSRCATRRSSIMSGTNLMDNRRPPETEKFRISDYLAASERELALSPNAPRTPSVPINTTRQGQMTDHLVGLLGDECSICHARAVVWDVGRDIVLCHACGAHGTEKAERRSVPIRVLSFRA